MFNLGYEGSIVKNNNMLMWVKYFFLKFGNVS